MFGWQVDYNSLPNEIKQEYGQILYKNNDGTYSTELHTTADRNSSTYYKRSYILKSYIPYSARYEDSGYNITINYTLDNFLTVEGMIGDVYYTKSGYLTEKDLVSSIEVDGSVISGSPDEWTSMSEETLLEMINTPQNHEVIVTLSDGTEFSNRTGAALVSLPSGGSEIQYWDDAEKAVEYYVKSYIFSNWFYEKLSGITADKLKNSQYSVIDVQGALNSAIEVGGNDIKTELQKDMVYSFSGDTTKPFAALRGDGSKNDPESEDSDFYEHKRKVIKNSITYNMILSILVYSEESGTTEYNMPVLSETEWDTILNNISITAFMQGMRCGLKYYNNYAIVTSTNNEISVTDNEIYYTPREIEGTILANLSDDDYIETAHRIDCEKLTIGKDENFQGGNWLGCISFKSKEIKYDKILNKDGSYTYDHKAYTDYDCIVDSNYTVKNVDNSYKDGNTDVREYLVENVAKYRAGSFAPENADLGSQLEYKLLAYRIAIAKERNNLYKTTAFTENYGWQIINPAGGVSGTNVTVDLSELSNKNVNQISKIEIVIEGANISSPGVYTDEITARYNAVDDYDDVSQTISTTSTSRRTVELKKDFNTGSTVSSITVSSKNSTQFTVDSIKFYFK